MSTKVTRLHAIIRGRVQGVGYRFHAQETAEELGLTGWVMNRPERSVEVVAEGPHAALDQFLKFLQRGPSAAQVTDVQFEYLPATREFDAFRVEL